jgi:peptide/nickel transport system ATP-binding protein
VLGLVGESGCGKSTTARAVCGLEPVSAGRILFRGREVEPLSFRKRRADLLRIQMVFQNPYASLNPRRIVGSQIAAGQHCRPDEGPRDRRRIRAAVHQP